MIILWSVFSVWERFLFIFLSRIMKRIHRRHLSLSLSSFSQFSHLMRPMGLILLGFWPSGVEFPCVTSIMFMKLGKFGYLSHTISLSLMWFAVCDWNSLSLSDFWHMVGWIFPLPIERRTVDPAKGCLSARKILVKIVRLSLD